jgi:hypothetical protein
VYTNGQTSGTATFIAPSTGGTYVVRAFLNDSQTLLAESTSFTISGSTISTDKSSYAGGSTITVTYSGLPGNPHDWIALAPAGSPASTYVAWVYTGGLTRGTATFSAPGSLGTYVVRAFLNDTTALLAESAPFSVSTSSTISTDKSSYASGATITVTYAGLPGNAHDWIALAPASAPDTSYLAWVYTGGQTSGTTTFTAPNSGGSYVVRAFLNDTFTRIAESTSFSVSNNTLSTDKSSYASDATITVTYAGLPGNAHDWLALAPSGVPNTTWVAWVYTGGQISGTATFTAPSSAGSYIVRAFLNDTLTLLAESASFTVTP